MTLALTQELCHALASQPGKPLKIEDPVTNAEFVLVPLDVYERMQRAANYDDSEPDPRDFYPAFAEAVKGDLGTRYMDN